MKVIDFPGTTRRRAPERERRRRNFRAFITAPLGTVYPRIRAHARRMAASAEVIMLNTLTELVEAGELPVDEIEAALPRIEFVIERDDG